MLRYTTSALEGSARELNTFENRNGASRTFQSWPFVAYLFSIGSAVNAVLLIGLVLSLSNTESVVWAFSAAALTGGLLFTVLEMRKLRNPSK